ncbi:MAG: long-chain fatty acid transporter, partial [Alistipes sp.]|nr:long-chain fatty acid transporter [Alistipes sp.]
FNPETPSMTKLTYTCGVSLRPTKCLSVDLAYNYVSSADPERTGSVPFVNNLTGQTEYFSGNYSVSAHVVSIGIGLRF